MKKQARIVFMGTASFAVPTLDRLLKSGHKIVAVVTAPDKPAGRGKKIRFSPVKEYALANRLTLLQPERLKDGPFIAQLSELDPEIAVVVAFRMLPEAVWKLPTYGTLNLHASLLPQFRGAAPINHAIMQGMKITGVTTFFIDEKIDTGRIIKQASLPVSDDETAGELHDRLMDLGAELTLQTVQDILEGSVQAVSQETYVSGDEALLPAPKIFKEDCRINWDQDVERTYNFIRGLSPAPGAFTTLLLEDGNAKTLKVYHSKMDHEQPTIKPGMVRLEKNTLEVACKNGFLILTEIQLEGKKKMKANDFLRGFNPKIIVGMG